MPSGRLEGTASLGLVAAGLSNKQIARSLGISKAVVYRILQSLVSRSLVEGVPGHATYQLGPTAIGLGTRAWSQMDVRSVAAPILRELRGATGETTTLSILVGRHRIYLDQFESPQEIKMVVEIGPRFSVTSQLEPVRARDPGEFTGGVWEYLFPPRPSTAPAP